MRSFGNGFLATMGAIAAIAIVVVIILLWIWWSEKCPEGHRRVEDGTGGTICYDVRNRWPSGEPFGPARPLR